MPRNQRLYNALLTVVNVAVAIVMLLVLNFDSTSVFVTLGLGIITAALLAYSSSWWGTLSAVILSIAGPPLVNAVMPDADVVLGPWLFSMIAGWFIGSTIRAPRSERVREREAKSSELQWTVGRKLFVEDAPTAEQAVSKVRALDGAARSHVVMKHRGSRLDVCGRADGALTVFHSPDTLDDESWSMAITPTASTDQVTVMMGNIVNSVEQRHTVNVSEAEEAVRHFQKSGTRNPALTWWTSPDVLSITPRLGE
jgi:hypothetical protein